MQEPSEKQDVESAPGKSKPSRSRALKDENEGSDVKPKKLRFDSPEPQREGPAREDSDDGSGEPSPDEDASIAASDTEDCDVFQGQFAMNRKGGPKDKKQKPPGKGAGLDESPSCSWHALPKPLQRKLKQISPELLELLPASTSG